MARRVIATAEVDVRADTSAFRREISRLGSAFRGMGRGVGNLRRMIGGLGLGRLAIDALRFGSEYQIAVDNATASILGLAGANKVSGQSFDQIRNYASGATDSMTGLSEAERTAATLLREMTEYAINTTFDIPGVQKSTTLMLAYGEAFGVTTDNVIDFVDIVANAAIASGKGSESMESVITVLGRISGQGRVMTRDMNQLVRNFPALRPWEILAEMTGKTVNELRQLAIRPGGLSGIVDANEFVNELLEGMKDIPGAAGAMERRMMTLAGSAEVFQETLGLTVSNGLGPFWKGLQELMKSDEVNDAIRSLVETFSTLAVQFIQQLIPYLPQIIYMFQHLLAAIQPLIPYVGDLAILFIYTMQGLMPVIDIFVIFVGVVRDMLNALHPETLRVIGAALAALWLVGFGPLGAIVAAVAVFANLIRIHWDNIVFWTDLMVQTIVKAWDWFYENVIERVARWVTMIVGFFMDLYDTLVGNSIIPDLVEAIVDWFNTLLDIAKVIWNGIKRFIIAPIQAVWDFMVAAWGAIGRFLSGVWDGVKWAVNVAWGLIKDYIINPVQAAWDFLVDIFGGVVGWISDAWSALTGDVSAVWEGVKDAIIGPVEDAWAKIQEIAGWIVDKVQWVGRQLSNLAAVGRATPGAGGGVLGTVGSALGFVSRWFADGGVVDRPTIAGLGEGGRPEAVIPLTNPGRAMQLMQQTGLSRLAAAGTGDGPLVQMNGTVIQDATDADLVAQRTLVAMQGAMAG